MGPDDSTSTGEKPVKTPRWFALQNDESILMLARPSRGATFYKYFYTLGLYGFWRKRNTSVITNRRILTGRGIVNREERSIPMSRVEDVKFTRRGLNSYAQVAVREKGQHRTEKVGPLSSRAARRFTAAILERL